MPEKSGGVSVPPSPGREGLLPGLAVPSTRKRGGVPLMQGHWAPRCQSPAGAGQRQRFLLDANTQPLPSPGSPLPCARRPRPDLRRGLAGPRLPQCDGHLCPFVPTDLWPQEAESDVCPGFSDVLIPGQPRKFRAKLGSIFCCTQLQKVREWGFLKYKGQGRQDTFSA